MVEINITNSGAEAMIEEDFPEESEEIEDRRTEEKAILATPVTIDGYSLTIGDIFPDPWDAKRFAQALRLLKATPEKVNQESGSSDESV